MRLTAIYFMSFLLLFFSQADAKTCTSKMSDVDCLICNCYFESRGESYEGQVAVGKVVVSRKMSGKFRKTICGVVWQESQFSWTNDGKPDEMTDASAIKSCRSAAAEAVQITSIWGLYFHNPSVSPKWAKKRKKIGRIGNHIFYSSAEDVFLDDTGGGRAVASLTESKNVEKPAQKRSINSEEFFKVVSERDVVLTEAIQQALAKWDRTFQLLQRKDLAQRVLSDFGDFSSDETPFAVSGDFDGDGKIDLGVIGVSQGQLIVAMLLKETNGFSVKEVTRFAKTQNANGTGQVYLSLLRAQKVDFEKSKTSDLLQVEIWGASSTAAYMVRDGRVTQSNYTAK